MKARCAKGMRSGPTLRTSDWTPTERLLLFLVPGRSVPPAVNLKMFIREGYIPSLPSAWEPQMILCVKRRSLTRELAVRSIGPRVVLEVIALLSITSAVPALSAELNDCGCVKIKTETVENRRRQAPRHGSWSPDVRRPLRPLLRFQPLALQLKSL